MPKPETVAEIMTREVVTVLEEDNLAGVQVALETLRFHHLPVVDDGKVVGMLSHRDLLRATVTGMARGALVQAREERFLERTFVRDLMQTQVATIRQHDSIKEAARRMLERRVGALPVVDEANQLVGIVTENDLVRTLLL